LFRKCTTGRHGCVVVDGHDIITVPETNIITFVPSASTRTGTGRHVTCDILFERRCALAAIDGSDLENSEV
jgi:hypothetical protein